MILGIGTDIIEIERIKEVIERLGDKFLCNTFTHGERVYCSKYKDKSARFAARFAAKEAFVKALGTGFEQNVTFLDIEIQNDSKGKPTILLADHLIEKFGSFKIDLSISHCKSYATAFVVLSTY